MTLNDEHIAQLDRWWQRLKADERAELIEHRHDELNAALWQTVMNAEPLEPEQPPMIAVVEQHHEQAASGCRRYSRNMSNLRPSSATRVTNMGHAPSGQRLAATVANHHPESSVPCLLSSSPVRGSANSGVRSNGDRSQHGYRAG